MNIVNKFNMIESQKKNNGEQKSKSYSYKGNLKQEFEAAKRNISSEILINIQLLKNEFPYIGEHVIWAKLKKHDGQINLARIELKMLDQFQEKKTTTNHKATYQHEEYYNNYNQQHHKKYSYYDRNSNRNKKYSRARLNNYNNKNISYNHNNNNNNKNIKYVKVSSKPVIKNLIIEENISKTKDSEIINNDKPQHDKIDSTTNSKTSKTSTPEKNKIVKKLSLDNNEEINENNIKRSSCSSRKKSQRSKSTKSHKNKVPFKVLAEIDELRAKVADCQQRLNESEKEIQNLNRDLAIHKHDTPLQPSLLVPIADLQKGVQLVISNSGEMQMIYKTSLN